LTPVIPGAYKFAIPLISTSCFCGCSDRTHRCTIHDYSYRKCYVGLLCYRTYQSTHHGTGCGSNERSEQCCEIRIDSYGNRSFTAVKLGQPETLAVFR
ncbi:hypothetical protein COOONC_11473, partial [Cooperia oncophora]